MKDIAKGLVFAGIFAIPFIPLIISNSMFFPFITGKNFTFRVLTEVIFAAWVILALYEPQYRPRFSWIVGAFSVLLVVMLFANVLGKNPEQSFWSNFERMEGYVTLVHVYLYLIVVGSVLRTQKLWSQFFATTITAAVIVSFYAFAQLSGNITINQGGVRLDGTLGNATYMAVYTLFHIFITIFMFLRTKSEGLRYLYAILIVAFVFLLLQTATRGTTLGLVGGLGVFTLYLGLFAREFPRVRKVAAGGLLTLVCVVVLFIAFKDMPFIKENPYLGRIASISLEEGRNRFMIWGMAFEGVKERPLLGWGQGNYNYVFNKYFRPELHGQEAWFDRVHNIVMDWLVAGGVIGALAYFSIFASAVYYLAVRPFREKTDATFSVTERGLLLGLLAGYLVHNMFVFDNIVSYLFYGTILAYIHARVTEHSPVNTEKVDRRIIDQIVAPVVLVVAIVVVYTVNVPGIQASKDIINAFRTNDPTEMMRQFDVALARNSFGDQEIREQMMQRVSTIFQSTELSPEEKQKAFKHVEEELLKQVEEKPDDARIQMFVSSFYRMTNNLDPALVHLERARELSPRKQLIIFELGITYIQKGDYENALRVLKEAYDLGPQFVESRAYYAAAAVYAGKQDLYRELITTDADKYTIGENQLAVQAIYGAKMYPELIEVFEVQIQRRPSDPQLRTNLAFVLNEVGSTTEAIKVLEEAAQDIPTFKEQSAQFIASLKAEQDKKKGN